MEQKKPHYDLSVVQADVVRLAGAAFTKSALLGGLGLGLAVPQMLRIIAGLRKTDFYKSMTCYQDHRQWQDVYHPRLPSGLELYVKVTYRLGQCSPVISFKEK